MANKQFRLCVTPCPHYIRGGDTYNLCVSCMGVEHERSALEGADCAHYEHLALRTLRSWLALFDKSAQVVWVKGVQPFLSSYLQAPFLSPKIQHLYPLLTRSWWVVTFAVATLNIDWPVVRASCTSGHTFLSRPPLRGVEILE